MIVVPLILAFTGIYLTNRAVTKVGGETAKAILVVADKLIQEQRSVGVQCIEKDLQALGRAIIDTIVANGKTTRTVIEETVEAIREDGRQTREAIKATQEKR